MRLLRTQKFITFILAVLLTSALIGMPLIEAQNLKPVATNQLQVKGLNSSTVGDSRYYEASDNGANYVGWKAPTTLAGNVTWQLPAADASGVFKSDGNGVMSIGDAGVTSVGLSLPNIFTISNSPVTSTGTLTGTFATQTANTVFAGPTSGGAATPAFRALTVADDPLITSTGAYIMIPPGAVSGSGGGAVLSANNQIRFWRFPVTNTITISKMVFRVVTGQGSSTGGAGIYSADGSTLLASGTAATTGSSTVSNVSVGPVTLNPGFYLCAYTNTNSAVTYTEVASDSNFSTAFTSINSKVFGVCANASSSGVLNATCGSQSDPSSTFLVPIIKLE